MQPDGNSYGAQIRKVYTFENLGKVEVPEVSAGDVVAVIGIEQADRRRYHRSGKPRRDGAYCRRGTHHGGCV